MHPLPLRKSFVLILVLLSVFSMAQLPIKKKASTKYPSLMWEITGNGMKKPSYLFGTMHASSKMVFHLSDSFYNAIKSCDAVSLELNPETWQPEMFRMEDAQRSIRAYSISGSNDYLNEKSFRLEDYDDRLKTALNEDPTQINGLLYRTFQPQADFEENTYLDLYIYQTGRKLGKKAAGVEDYFETEKLILEAYQDMAKEKKKKKVDTDGESYYDIGKKLQDAYRRGDLDLLDSLNKLTVTSDAFNEKFLYKRNEIQANSIDSILKKQTLFVGVGAAHLPGNRGVIELLRRMGYKLRPMKMADRDADQKEQIDKLRVPVKMNSLMLDDGFLKFSMPGKLYRRSESRLNESWQYADMENGTYYMVTRVKTHAPTLGQNEETAIKKVDSFLYENIPGKILKKTIITKNGYKGYDITNKTRRGDIQRYNILVTPFEVLVFKMSGNDEYVYGKEADEFFGSIQVNEQKNAWADFQPAMGGFTVPLPQKPNVSLNKNTNDGINTWEYEAIDKTTGEAYSIWKKSLHNYQFLEEDSFDLSLIEESLLHSEMVEKQSSRKFGSKNGYPFLDMQFALKNGDVLHAKGIIKGPHQYLLMARGKKKSANFDRFFNGFTVTDFKYAAARTFKDTSFKFSVQAPVIPSMDEEIRSLVEKVANDESLYQSGNESYNYWPKSRIARFVNDTTGEAVLVSTQAYPVYYYSKDSAKFWSSEFLWHDLEDDYIGERKFIKLNDSVAGYKFSLLDTNSTRKMIGLCLLKNNRIFRVTALTDNVGKESSFIRSFFDSFMPDTARFGPSVFDNKLDQFFADYYSKDTATKKKANAALSHLYYGPEGMEKIKEAIGKLKLGDKDYFDTKSRFISEIGFIDDSCCTDKVVAYLKELYNQTADTSSFQNPILISLARLKTTSSYALLKELLLQDPPIFDGGDYNYNDLFSKFNDSLALAKTMFPEILQLASLDDYKYSVNSLLINLVDSGYIKSTDYESYYSKLYFDAKIELKRQSNRDERAVEKESNKDDEEESTGNSRRYYDDESSSGIDNYSVLLMPFYDKYPAVQKFYDKLLLSKDDDVKLSTAILMLRNKRIVADSVLENLAAKDQYRSRLLKELEDIEQTNLFPSKYKTQESLAKSILLADKSEEKFHAIELVAKKLIEVKNKKGYVYFFKYKLKKDDEWKMGISGLQPVNLKKVSSDDYLVKMTDKKMNEEELEVVQFEKELKKLIFSLRKSAAYFFEERGIRNMYGYGD
jgi:uncharacterized protein YbaP (TraB family)